MRTAETNLERARSHIIIAHSPSRRGSVEMDKPQPAGETPLSKLDKRKVGENAKISGTK